MREKKREASAASSRSIGLERGLPAPKVIVLEPNRAAIATLLFGLYDGGGRASVCGAPQLAVKLRWARHKSNLAAIDHMATSCDWNIGQQCEGDDLRGVSIVADTEAQEGRTITLAAWAVGGSIALIALQAFAARRLELTFDEAYYTLWSRSLAFGYLDHPPMVALFIRASTGLFGGSELGVRALSLFLVGTLPGLIALIAFRLFRSAQTAALAALMW